MKPKDDEEALEVMKIDQNAELPDYAIDNDIAFDLRANEDVKIDSFEQKEVKTGVAIKIPKGYVGLVRDRVGIVTRMAAHVVAGTFNSNYHEEVTVFIINFSDDEILIEKGMRVAQMVIVPIKKLKIKEVKKLSGNNKK